MPQFIRKRNGKIEAFDCARIAAAILKAFDATGAGNKEIAVRLAEDVSLKAEELYGIICDVESIQDLVESALIAEGMAGSAKAYILYREKRRNARESDALVKQTIKMFSDYLGERDWQVNENANTQKSINGLNNYVRESFTKSYWLYEVYPEEIRTAHQSGDIHLHDLGFFGAYCAGWDLKQLLLQGFGGFPGKVESKPPKHLRSFLGQIVNSTFTTQGETAGAQAWSSFDTYCAPFVRYDGLDYAEIKQAMQEFIFNLNVPTRVGFQCPFSNLTFDIKVPELLKNEAVIIGGKPMKEKYGDFQAEMDLINLAFCEVMLEGDKMGRVFTFPIPTLNITKNFDWDSPVTQAFMKTACKYGLPYFSNYISSDLSPEDALSMCCRLRLDTKELRKRGGGLFGSNPLTGSIGVVTVNLPRLGYLARTEDDFFVMLRRMISLASSSLEIKRKVVERQTEAGMYPYCAAYLSGLKERTGQYWYNHFNTIGLVGMNEACLNLMGKDITTAEGQVFSKKVLGFMRDELKLIQERTGNYYNLEATPAEGTTYRLARLDKELFPDIITAGGDVPYYTNSSQLPVGYTDDIFETMELQDELQCMYTGGTVLHLYLGEQIDDVKAAERLIRNIFENYKLPYISLTPTFSVCPDHGYLRGEQFTCPECGRETEVWSRVVGYLRPVKNYNKGKKKEYAERVKYSMPESAGT